jgi:chitinase
VQQKGNMMDLRPLAAITFLLISCAFGAQAADRADSGPRYIIYYNSNASPVTDAVGLPYTHVVLTFVGAQRTGAGIVVTAPDNMTTQLAAISRLQAAGQKVMVSYGGGAYANADYQPFEGHETELATALAAFVAAHGLDGIDIDFEVSEALHLTRPAGILNGARFLTRLTLALRTAMGPHALISHAPQGPYLDPGWHGGPYLQILRDAGDAVDWINVQYYNNPDFNAALAPGDPAWSYAGLTSGKHGLDWPPEKTVVAKPVYKKDAASGYVAPEDLSKAVIAPLVARYGTRFGGLAGWQFSTHTDDHLYWNARMADALNPPAHPTQP